MQQSLSALCRTVTLVFADHSALLHVMLSRVLAAGCNYHITMQVGAPPVSPFSKYPSYVPLGI
jgi:hypothetical protein